MSGDSGFQMADDGISDRYDIHMWRFMEPHVAAVVDAASIASGESVLDVASGTGYVARSALERGAGRVVGTDVNPGMLETARRRGPGITWIEASALDLPFDDGEFDVVTCSQGVQFFPDHVAGLREMARVGRRMVVTAWSLRSHVPWFDAHIPMLIDTCGVDEAMMEMSFSEEDEVRGWFAASGLDARLQPLRTVVTLERDFSVDYLSALPWGQPFFELDPADRRAALASVDQHLERYRQPNGDVILPFNAHLITTAT